MNKSPVFLKRVILIISILTAITTTFGQIIYSDFNNTEVIFPSGDPGTNYYNFDINKDEVGDLVFVADFYEMWGSPSAPEIPVRHLVVNGIGDSFQIAVAPLNVFFYNDVIDETSEYLDYTELITNDNYGDWNESIYAEDDYLGFRKKINGEYHYGWIRLDCWTIWGWTWFPDFTIVIKDCGFNTIPGEYIKAGQTEYYTTIDEPVTIDFKIVASSNHIYIYPKNGNEYHANIFDITGRLLMTAEHCFGQRIFSLPGINSSLYLVRIRSGENIFTQKVLLSNN